MSKKQARSVVDVDAMMKAMEATSSDDEDEGPPPLEKAGAAAAAPPAVSPPAASTKKKSILDDIDGDTSSDASSSDTSSDDDDGPPALERAPGAGNVLDDIDGDSDGPPPLEQAGTAEAADDAGATLEEAPAQQVCKYFSTKAGCQFGGECRFLHPEKEEKEAPKKKKVKETEFYDLLGVEIDCDINDIRRAYKLAAVESHPDKNQDDPDAELKFKRISEAYDVLSDAKTRRVYDRRGQLGLEDHADRATGPGRRGGRRSEDIFKEFYYAHFFSTEGVGGQYTGSRRGHDAYTFDGKNQPREEKVANAREVPAMSGDDLFFANLMYQKSCGLGVTKGGGRFDDNGRWVAGATAMKGEKAAKRRETNWGIDNPYTLQKRKERKYAEEQAVYAERQALKNAPQAYHVDRVKVETLEQRQARVARERAAADLFAATREAEAKATAERKAEEIIREMEANEQRKKENLLASFLSAEKLAAENRRKKEAEELAKLAAVAKPVVPSAKAVPAVAKGKEAKAVGAPSQTAAADRQTIVQQRVAANKLAAETKRLELVAAKRETREEEARHQAALEREAAEYVKALEEKAAKRRATAASALKNVCKFFSSKAGCRNGSKCRDLHEAKKTSPAAMEKKKPNSAVKVQPTAVEPTVQPRHVACATARCPNHATVLDSGSKRWHCVECVQHDEAAAALQKREQQRAAAKKAAREKLAAERAEAEGARHAAQLRAAALEEETRRKAVSRVLCSTARCNNTATFKDLDRQWYCDPCVDRWEAEREEEERHRKERAAPSVTKKAVICKAFKLSGWCRFGGKCRDAHVDPEADRRAAEEREQEERMRKAEEDARRHEAKNKKNVTPAVCKFFKKSGSCRFGVRCRDLHVNPEETAAAPPPTRRSGVRVCAEEGCGQAATAQDSGDKKWYCDSCF